MPDSRANLSLDLPGLPRDRRELIIRRIAHESRVRRSTAERWFVEMLKFLAICADADAPAAPPRRVDKAWHVFMLFTRDYASYCQASHGAFIHHDPMEKKDVEAYERTYVWAEALYGELPRRVWPPPPSRASGWLGGAIGGCGGGCGGGGCGGGGG